MNDINMKVAELPKPVEVVSEQLVEDVKNNGEDPLSLETAIADPVKVLSDDVEPIAKTTPGPIDVTKVVVTDNAKEEQMEVDETNLDTAEEVNENICNENGDKTTAENGSVNPQPKTNGEDTIKHTDTQIIDNAIETKTKDNEDIPIVIVIESESSSNETSQDNNENESPIEPTEIDKAQLVQDNEKKVDDIIEMVENKTVGEEFDSIVTEVMKSVEPEVLGSPSILKSDDSSLDEQSKTEISQESKNELKLMNDIDELIASPAQIDKDKDEPVPMEDEPIKEQEITNAAEIVPVEPDIINLTETAQENDVPCTINKHTNLPNSKLEKPCVETKKKPCVEAKIPSPVLEKMLTDTVITPEVVLHSFTAPAVNNLPEPSPEVDLPEVKAKSPPKEVISPPKEVVSETKNVSVEKNKMDVDAAVKIMEKLEKKGSIKVVKPEQLAQTNGDLSKEEQSSKRRPSSDDFETESPLKKLCQEVERTFPQHDTMVNEYIQTATKNNIDEIQKHTEHLLAEIQTLRELAQKKEYEWNHILHLKKVKEEILLRLLRRKQVISFEKSPEINGSGSERKDPFEYLNQAKSLAIDKSDEISGLALKQPIPPSPPVNPSPMIQPPMMPVTSHFNPLGSLPPPYDKVPIQGMASLPKQMYPQSLMMPGPTMPGFPRDMNGQLQSNFGLPMGRQGPTKDVKSIIADYRQRNPDVTPRRGRRMKSLLNPNMMNSQQPRPIAPKMDNLGMIFNNLDMNQKAMLERLSQMQGVSFPNGMSFKDVLVQFANMQQQGMMPLRPDLLGRMEQQCRMEPPSRLEPSRPDVSRPEVTRPEVNRAEVTRPEQSRSRGRQDRQQHQQQHEEVHISMKSERMNTASPRLPPPPYPEISLLPVNQEGGSQQQNSLLHGILTKQACPASQSCSPTLAKLLTSPEVKQNSTALPTFGQAKNCGEITITPVQPLPAPPEAAPAQDKPEEVVQLDDEESPASEGSTEENGGEAGRLVIDEGTSRGAGADGGTEGGEDTPLCQGCRRRDAQFVCAGCANQWYCSRDCQVAAWDEHSDMCSG